MNRLILYFKLLYIRYINPPIIKPTKVTDEMLEEFKQYRKRKRDIGYDNWIKEYNNIK